MQEEKVYPRAALTHRTFGDWHHELTVIGIDEPRKAFLQTRSSGLCADAEVTARRGVFRLSILLPVTSAWRQPQAFGIQSMLQLTIVAPEPIPHRPHNG